MPYGQDPIQAAPSAVTATPNPPPGSVGLPEWAGGAKTGYGHDPVQTAPPADPDQPGTLERIGRKALSPLIGMEQLAGTLLPIPAYDPKTGKWVPRLQADMETERHNEERIAKTRKGEGAIDPERMAIDTVNPLNWATALVAPEIRAGGAVTQGAERLASRVSPQLARSVAGGVAERAIPPIVGGLTAAEQPVDNAKTLGEFVDQKRKQIAGGMVGGKVGDMAAHTLGSMIAPTMGRGQQILHDLGVRMSPGQVQGGTVQRAEEAMSSIPLVGTSIRHAERQGVEGFNRASVNEVLRPIGGSLPDHIAAGRDAIGYAQQQLNAAYNGLLPNLRFRSTLTPGSANTLRTILADVTQLGPQYAADFQRQMDRVVFARLRGGGMTGETFKEVELAMTNMINDYASGDPIQRHMSCSFDQVLDVMRSELEAQNPRYAGALENVNRAYAMLSRVEDASMNTVTPDGVFMPSSLLREVRKAARQTGRRKSYARGDAQMQDFAEAGQEVLPRNLRDSGTPERLLWTSVLTPPLAGSGYEFGAGRTGIGAALGLGTLRAAYSEPAMRAFQNWFGNQSPARRAIGQGVSNAGTYVAPALGIGGGQSTQ